MIAGKTPIDTGGNRRLNPIVTHNRVRKAYQDSSCRIISKMFQNFFPRVEAFQSAAPRLYRRLAMKLSPRGFAILCSAQRVRQCNAEVTTIYARLLKNAVVLVPADRADPVKDLPTSFIRLHSDGRSTDEGLSEEEFRSSLARTGRPRIV